MTIIAAAVIIDGENGATLNVEYLASRDPKPSLDAELSAQCVTHWKPLD